MYTNRLSFSGYTIPKMFNLSPIDMPMPPVFVGAWFNSITLGHICVY